MFSVENLRELIEEYLNDGLYATILNQNLGNFGDNPNQEQRDQATRLAQYELNHNPFKIFSDIGEAEESYRSLNDVFSHRYGVISVLSSNVTPINGLEIYNATVSVDILVNVDKSISVGDNAGEYKEVKETRDIIDQTVVTASNQAAYVEINNISYSIVPVFTLSTAGTFEVQASKLGKIVPLSFTVDFSVVQEGVNSSRISLWINGYQIPCTQFAEDMIASAEGQTRAGNSNSTFNIQESKYAISFVTPLLNNDFYRELISLMHNGNINNGIPVYNVKVWYPLDYPYLEYVHSMVITSIRLTAQIPNNAGLNIEMIESDQPYEQS